MSSSTGGFTIAPWSMAELGSHQLDACSIFLGKRHPLAVTGIGGNFFYTDGRESGLLCLHGI